MGKPLSAHSILETTRVGGGRKTLAFCPPQPSQVQKQWDEIPGPLG